MPKTNRIKSVLPYVLPILSLALVSFMFFRWYRARTAQTPNDFLNSEDFQVQTLPTQQQEQLVKGTTDFDAVKMEASGTASGEIRYQVTDDSLNFSVTANLPDSPEDYAVWLRTPGTDARRHIFNLQKEKAGYIGSASVSTQVLPVEIVVTKASDLMLDDVLLRGTIEATASTVR